MRKLGPIQCLDLIRDPEAPWVVLFHGYGADASDLFDLADMIPVSKPVNFLFPQGIKEVPIGPGWTGRAWWDIDMERIQRDAMSGVERDTGSEIPAGLPTAREKTNAMMKAFNVPWNKVILGGFSQGGMIATDMALMAPENPRGLILMSSAPVNREEWKTKVAARAGVPFFQSHGERDTVLTAKNGSRLETLLNQGGMKGRIKRFVGGHEIPPSVIQELGLWLNEIL